MSDNKIPPLPLTGGCQCGQLRYRVTERPITLYCCHCTDCQSQSASAFGMSLRLPAEGLEVEGDYGSKTRDPELDTANEAVFCPQCGCRVAHLGRGADESIAIKAASLDDRSWLQPVGHIWTRSAQSWVKLDGLLYDTDPDDGYSALIEAFAEKFG